MRSIACAAAAAIVLTGAIASAQHKGHDDAKPVATATAEIKGEGITGTATFSEVKHGTASAVHVELSVSGLKPGLHGVHLHAIGKCEPPAFTAAGGHFDPGPAGNTDPDANHPFHMGDLPNLSVGDDGKGVLQGGHHARDAERQPDLGLRRRQHRDHHSRQPRPGHHRRAEVRRQRRSQGRLRRARQKMNG